MIRWLSQRWVSGAVDRGHKPPRLWRWTFGRFAWHRGFADDLHELDVLLRRQAASQQRVISRGVMPVGHYPVRPSSKPSNQPQPATSRGVWIARPALAAGLCVVIAGAVWLARPQTTTYSPQQVQEAFARVWEPLNKQAQTTGQALRDRAELVSLLPERLPAIDEVVNNLGNAIESPIREEVRRFTRDLTRPWTYLAEQLPLPRTERTDEPAAG